MIGRVLVTGSDGFIGSVLIKELARTGYEVFRFDLSDGDISRNHLPFTEISNVVHLAARTYIPDSWADPFSFYQVNVMGTANVLEFCRRQGCSVTFLSSYLYGLPKTLPINEEAPIAPNTPYNHSKALAEDLGRFYAEKFALPVTVLRPFNIYGPGQRSDFLIPTLVRQILDPACEEIEVADLEPRRDYLYVDDLVQAIMATLKASLSYSIFNIGSGQSYSVADVIQTLQSAAGTSKPVRSRMQRRPGEVMDTVADISKARTALAWTPSVPFSEGIRRLVTAVKVDNPTIP